MNIWRRSQQKKHAGKRISRRQWRLLYRIQSQQQLRQEIAATSQHGSLLGLLGENPTVRTMRTTLQDVEATVASELSNLMRDISLVGATGKPHAATSTRGLSTDKTNVLGG
jgi:hypothetical protein